MRRLRRCSQAGVVCFLVPLCLLTLLSVREYPTPKVNTVTHPDPRARVLPPRGSPKDTLIHDVMSKVSQHNISHDTFIYVRRNPMLINVTRNVSGNVQSNVEENPSTNVSYQEPRDYVMPHATSYVTNDARPDARRKPDQVLVNPSRSNPAKDPPGDMGDNARMWRPGAGSRRGRLTRGVPGNYPENEGMDLHTDTHTEDGPPEVGDDRRQEDDTCRLPEISPISKSIAKELFESAPEANCDHQRSEEVCHISVSSAAGTKVRCQADLCHGNIRLGVTDADAASVRWENMASLSRLETRITQVLETRPLFKHRAFCLVKCRASGGGPDVGDITNDAVITQLLTFPPFLAAADDIQPQRRSASAALPISINIIHIDSISRHHFRRSLPRTSDVLKQTRNAGSRMRLLDFRLLQTLKARTHESLKMLFSGEIPPDLDLMTHPFDRDDVPGNSTVVFEVLLKSFKRNGYFTLYMEDLCWRSGWGLVNHVGVDPKSPGAWEKFTAALKRSHIDDYGPSLSSCELLRLNNITQPFHGPPAICLNGRFQHQYNLDYLERFQETLTSQKRPYFSFFMTNVAHEHTGLRVRTLDLSFSRYLQSLWQFDNVITVITADHGSAYGEYVQRTLQGRLEMFNPPLYILIPERFIATQPPHWVQALEQNQNRLVTFLDLHLFLKRLIDASPTQGMLRKGRALRQGESILRPFPESLGSSGGLGIALPASRSCQDLPMLVDTLCICEGHQVRAAPQPRYVLLATFALGEINNLLQRQRLETDPGSQTPRCLPLAVGRLLDVWVSHHQETSTAKLNIAVLPEHLFDHNSHNKGSNTSHIINNTRNHSTNRTSSHTPYPTHEVWTVTVRWRPGQSPSRMRLTSVTRLSPYAHYRACAEPGLDLKFCICSLPVRSGSARDATGDATSASGKITRDVTLLTEEHRVVSDAGGGALPGTRNEDHPLTPLPDFPPGALFTGSSLPTSTTRGRYSARHADSITGTASAKNHLNNGFYLGRYETGYIHGVKQDCLKLVFRRNSMGVAFWIRNWCGEGYRVFFSLSVINMDVSKGPAFHNIQPRTAVFLAVCIQSSPHLDFYWKYKTHAEALV